MTRSVECGPCNDGICDWMGCSLPGLCTCEHCHDEPDDRLAELRRWGEHQAREADSEPM